MCSIGASAGIGDGAVSLEPSVDVVEFASGFQDGSWSSRVDVAGGSGGGVGSGGRMQAVSRVRVDFAERALKPLPADSWTSSCLQSERERELNR